jgi:hypothetical protein
VKIYQIGPDVPYDLSEDERFEWIVHYYEDGGYDGSGEAVGLCKDDGLLYVKNLGHCSCYGPMDGGMESGDKYTVEQFLSDKDDIMFYDPGKEMKDKVKELLGWKAPVFQEPFNFLD